MSKKIIFALSAILFLTVLCGRSYSAYIKQSTIGTSSCYYQGKLYQPGQKYMKNCNSCGCPSPHSDTNGDLVIMCTETACPHNFYEDVVKNIIFVK